MQLRNAPDGGHRSVAPQPYRLTRGNLPIYRTERYDLAYQRALRRSLSEPRRGIGPLLLIAFRTRIGARHQTPFVSSAIASGADPRSDQGRVEFRPMRVFAHRHD